VTVAGDMLRSNVAANTIMLTGSPQ